MSAEQRRRPATAARFAATGISVAGAVAIVGGLNAASRSGATASPATTPQSAPAVPTTTPGTSTPRPAPSAIVVEVHRTVYVDEFGHPVDPPNATPSGVTATSALSPVSRVVPNATSASSSGPRPRPTTTTTTVAPATTPPRTIPPAPACSGSKCP